MQTLTPEFPAQTQNRCHACLAPRLKQSNTTREPTQPLYLLQFKLLVVLIVRGQAPSLFLFGARPTACGDRRNGMNCSHLDMQGHVPRPESLVSSCGPRASRRPGANDGANGHANDPLRPQCCRPPLDIFICLSSSPLLVLFFPHLHLFNRSSPKPIVLLTYPTSPHLDRHVTVNKTTRDGSSRRMCDFYSDVQIPAWTASKYSL
jgi:hypothetical protein